MKKAAVVWAFVEVQGGAMRCGARLLAEESEWFPVSARPAFPILRGNRGARQAQRGLHSRELPNRVAGPWNWPLDL